LSEFAKDSLAHCAAVALDSRLVDRNRTLPSDTGADMPLDPLAKRFLAMAAAAAVDRLQPSTNAVRRLRK